MVRELYIIFILWVFIPTNVCAQQNYYWYFNKKIEVSYNYNHWAIKVIDGKKIVNESSILKKGKGVANLQEFSNGLYKIGLSSAITASDLSYEFVEYAVPSLTILEQENPLFMNGNIILMPNKESNIDLIAKKHQLKLLEKLNYGAYLFKVPVPLKTLDIANQIHESEFVEWCTPDFYVEMKANANDPLYSSQYYLTQSNNIDINAPEAWNMTKGCNNIRVAVLDEGVDTHEDLSGNLLTGFTPGSNNTYGFPIYSNEVHGTACAGIIAANHDNDKGIKGVAPYTKIVPVKILGGGGYSTSEIATAITWSYQSTGGNADILSNSWGYGVQGFYDSSIALAISNARTLGRGGKGTIVIFASGNLNDSWSGVTFPANLSGVITVGAINSSGAIWSYSSRGTEMDLVCPSGNIGYVGDVTTLDRMGSLGLNTGNYMSVFGGTSAACPQVAGVASLILSVNPNLTESEVRTILQQTATDMGSSGFDNTYGYGRLNAYAAVQAALPFSISGSLTLCDEETYTISNLPTGATVTWSIEGYGADILTTGTDYVTVIYSDDGSFKVKALVSTACGTIELKTDEIISGFPYWVGITDVSNDGMGTSYGILCSSTSGQDNYFNTFSYKVHSWASAIPFPLTLHYMLLNDQGVFYQSSKSISSDEGTVNLPNSIPSGFYDIEVWISGGACDRASEWYEEWIEVVNCGYYRMVVYPNPSNTELYIAYNNETNQSKTTKAITQNPFSVKLLNQKGKVLREGNTKADNSKGITLQVADIPNGIYYLHIYEGKKVSKQQVVIAH